MPTSLRLLLREDQQTDAELAVRELVRFGYRPDWRRVDTEEAFLDALDPRVGLVLADHNLPQFDSLQALDRLTQSSLDIPFLIVSGGICEEPAVSALKRGAADYLLKDRLARPGGAASAGARRGPSQGQGAHANVPLRRVRRSLTWAAPAAGPSSTRPLP